MENWDDDFSTLKGIPKNFAHDGRRSISSWKPDIPIADGDVTLKKNQAMMMDQDPDNTFGLDEEEDDDFANEFESAVRARKTPVPSGDNLPDAFLSDSSARSPGRTSISSAASASSVATSWENDDDFGIDFDEEEIQGPNLKARFRTHQERAQLEAEAEAAQLAARYAREVSKNRSPERKKLMRWDATAVGGNDLMFRPEENKGEDDDDLLDLGLEQLTLRVKNGTVNKNVKLQPPGTAGGNKLLNGAQSSPSKLLRGMRSIAQLPQIRSDISLPPPSSKLRGAVSMLDLGKSQHSPTRPSAFSQYAPNSSRFDQQVSRSQSQVHLQPHLQQSQSQQQHQPHVQRPLTAYVEPARKPTRPDGRKQKSKKPNLIRNPLNTLNRQERNGMVLNPQTGLWEGNDVDASRFDMVDSAADTVKPTLITKNNLGETNYAQPVNGMLFDNRTLSWVYADEEEYDDPFAGIDEEPITKSSASLNSSTSSSVGPSAIAPSPSRSSLAGRGGGLQPRLRPSRSSRVVTNESAASTGSTTSFASTSNFGRSSVARSEASGHEVFNVSARTAAEWRHADERFMRKFGKWIGGDEEKADALQSDQHFYEMVKNA